MRPVEFVFEFPARYSVQQLERIDRQFSGRVLVFPGPVEADPQQELAEWPILAVTPDDAEPWIGVFGCESGVYGGGPRCVVGWPDNRSICVIVKGGGCLVRTDDPFRTSEIDVLPITGMLVSPRHELVLFASFSYVVAHGADGVAWESERLGLDWAEILGVEGDVLRVAVDDPGGRVVVELDLRSGEELPPH